MGGVGFRWRERPACQVRAQMVEPAARGRAELPPGTPEARIAASTLPLKMAEARPRPAGDGGGWGGLSQADQPRAPGARGAGFLCVRPCEPAGRCAVAGTGMRRAFKLAYY